MTSTGSTLLGFFKAPFKGKIGRENFPGKKGRENFGSYGRDLCGREKK